MRSALPSRLTDSFEAYASDEASIAASERCSPNSIEWEGVAEGILEDEQFRARQLPHFLAAQGFGIAQSPGATAWPVFRPPAGRMFHVGSMDPSAKGSTHNATSHEGNGLSVSVHPATWRQIARLGGLPTWDLRRDGACFLDAHSLTIELRDTATTWAIEQGYVEMIPAIRTTYFDEEVGLDFSSLHDISTAEGRRMAALLSVELADAEMPRMAHVMTARATAAMGIRTGFSVPLGNVVDIALTFFVEDVLHASHGIDGVWWEDDLAPECLSAPRGVIHLQALQTWSAAQVHNEPSDRPRFR